MLLRIVNQVFGLSILKTGRKEEVMKDTDRMPEEVPGTKWDTSSGVMRARSADMPELESSQFDGGQRAVARERADEDQSSGSREAVAQARLVGERLIANACGELPPDASLAQRHDAIERYVRNIDKHLDEFLAPLDQDPVPEPIVDDR